MIFSENGKQDEHFIRKNRRLKQKRLKKNETGESQDLKEEGALFRFTGFC